MSSLPDLLDKVNHKKPNFRDITIRIIEVMFERDMGGHIVPELLKRFKTARNNDIIVFSIQLMELMMTKDKYIEIFHLKHIFNGIANTLVNPNNKIRDAGMSLLKELYIRIDDDCESIIRKLKHLKPVLKKEIKSTLSRLEKQEGSEYYRVFQKVQQKENLETEESQTPCFDKSPSKDMKLLDISEDIGAKEPVDDGKVDLISLVAEGFDKLPYENQVMEKKNALVELYKKLKQTYVSDKEIADGDNYKVYNVIRLMLEDTNALVCHEAIKIVELLAKLKDNGIKGKNAKQYTEILFERFKETKVSDLNFETTQFD